MLVSRHIGAAIVFGLLTTAAHAQSVISDLTVDQLKKFSPRANPGLLQSIIDNKQILIDAKIDTPRRFVHFLVQISTETGGLRKIDENLNYSSARLGTIFSVPRDIAQSLVGSPQKIANYVYGNKLGNRGRGTNDGWNYRGSGFIQLTGRFNFQRRGQDAGLDLENNPDLARLPKEGLLVATKYWTATGINAAADGNNLKSVRVLVNGKRALGLAAAREWYVKAKPIFLRGLESVSPEEETSVTADLLVQSGFLKPAVGTGETLPSPESITAALREYQRSRGLAETGTVDEDTLYALTDPDEWAGASLVEGTPAQPSGSAVGAPESGVAVDDPGARSASLEIATGKVTLITRDEVTEIAPAASKDADPDFKPPSTSELALSRAEAKVLAEAAPLYASYEAHPKGVKDTGFVPYSVIEPDTREVVKDTTVMPGSAVVQMVFVRKADGLHYNCTGSMIGPSTVLTAGHCVNEGGHDGAWHSDFVIYPGRNGAVKPFGSCAAAKLFALDGWVHAQSDEQAALYDLGAIKLDCTIGDATGWFGLMELPDGKLDQPTTIQGYPCDKDKGANDWVSHDVIRAILANKVFYQNDTYGCMSGSGVFSGDDYRLFAVHTNGVGDPSGLGNGEPPWNSNNAGTRLTAANLAQIQYWMAH